MKERRQAGLEARLTAAQILDAILREKKAMDEALDDHQPTERAFVMAMIAQTLRRLGEIDAMLFSFIKDVRRLKNNYALMILRLAAAQLLYMRVPPYAAIDLAVSAARAHRQARHFANLINAVLRQVAIAPKPPSRPEINVPAWLWQRWQNYYGAPIAHKIIAAHLEPPPLDLSFHETPPAIDGILLHPQTLRLQPSSPQKIRELAGYQQGGWWVQDIAASLPANLFGDIKGKRLLEFCAAPGGKTAQLAAQGAEITAIEINTAHGARWQENMHRLNFNAQLICTDARHYRAPTPFPFILLDAPCLGTGTCRRHPDLVWRREAAALSRLVVQQRALLDAAYCNLERGGTLIYCVCSLEPEEGVEIINHFLRDSGDMKRVPIKAAEIGGMDEILTKAGDIRSLPFHPPLTADASCASPVLGGMDGFYAVRLIRK